MPARRRGTEDHSTALEFLIEGSIVWWGLSIRTSFGIKLNEDGKATILVSIQTHSKLLRPQALGLRSRAFENYTIMNIKRFLFFPLEILTERP